MASKKGGLGRGLDAIFDENTENENSVSMIAVSDIEPNADQPRRHFDEQPLAELADSIKEHGVLQPLILRQTDKNRYEIVAGERRWRASRMAGLKEIPAIVKDLSESEAVELALIENLQREDLNIVEEACGYKVLAQEHGYTQDEIAKKVGKSRPAVANAMRVLKLPKNILKSVEEGKISAGHAKALLAFDDEKQLMDAAEKIEKNGISVREVEKLAQNKGQAPKTKPVNDEWGESFYREFQFSLENTLSQKVRIKQKRNKGVIEISFSSREEIEKIAKILADKINDQQ